jgi:hypothetical protein
VDAYVRYISSSREVEEMGTGWLTIFTWLSVTTGMLAMFCAACLEKTSNKKSLVLEKACYNVFRSFAPLFSIPDEI